MGKSTFGNRFLGADVFPRSQAAATSAMWKVQSSEKMFVFEFSSNHAVLSPIKQKKKHSKKFRTLSLISTTDLKMNDLLAKFALNFLVT
jgi:hypothetical protein